MTNAKELSVLIADNDEDSRFLFSKASLTCHFKGRLKFVDSSDKLLNSLKRSAVTPDLIVLNLGPSQKTLKTIRENPKWRNIPVIALSNSSADDANKNISIFHHFKKPDSFDGYVDLVQTVCKAA